MEMQMEWAFSIKGATASTGPAAESELRAIEGMITAVVDVGSSLAEVTFDADRVCGGEILAVLSTYGCVPSNSFDAREHRSAMAAAADLASKQSHRGGVSSEVAGI